MAWRCTKVSRNITQDNLAHSLISTQVVKALEPLFSAGVNAVVRGEILPLPVYAALIPVVGGVAVAIATDLSFNPLSFSAAMTSNLFSGLRAVLSKANLERTKQTAPELFGAATIGAACILAPLAFFVEGSKLSLDDLDTTRVALQVALSGLFHCPRCGVPGPSTCAHTPSTRPVARTAATARRGSCAIDATRRSHRGDGAGVGRDSRPHADLNNEVMYMCLARVNPVTFCVEINQCVGCTRNRHRHAIEQASRRWRGGRRDDSARTRRKF